MPSDHTRVAIALDLLTRGLYPYIEQEMASVFHERWVEAARGSFRNDRASAALARLEPGEWDAQALLTVMWDHWNAVFRARLGLMERSLVSELREFRNRWAHQSQFSDDDAHRTIDSVQRLLAAIGAPEDILVDLERLKLDILREKLSRQVQDSVLQSQYGYERLTDVALYSVCGLTINATTFLLIAPRNLLAALILCLFVTFAFGWLVWKRLRPSTPVYGVHECPKCRKIIYAEVCPYCDAPPPSSSILAGRSSTRFPPFQEATTQPL